MGCEFHFDAAVPVPAVVLLRAAQDDDVTVERETWHVKSTNSSFSDLVDVYGNRARRVVIGAGKASLRYDAEVTTSAALDEVSPEAVQHRVEDLPGELFIYMLASRYCLSDMLSDAAMDLFGTTPLGWERVQAVCDWVHDNVRFDYGATRPDRASVDVFQATAGVCRDFAHLAISFCRALNIPARYVFGYLPDIDVNPPPATCGPRHRPNHSVRDGHGRGDSAPRSGNSRDKPRSQELAASQVGIAVTSGG